MGNWDIYTMNVASGAVTRVTNTPQEERGIAWSGNGQWLAFQSNRTGDWNLYIVRPDGTDLRGVAISPAADQAPTWNCTTTRPGVPERPRWQC